MSPVAIMFKTDEDMLEYANQQLPFMNKRDWDRLDRITNDYARTGAISTDDRQWVQYLVDENGSR